MISTCLIRIMHSIIVIFLIKKNFFSLAALHGLWNPSSPTRDRTRAIGSENEGSQPLDCQRIPNNCKILLSVFLEILGGNLDGGGL